MSQKLLTPDSDSEEMHSEPLLAVFWLIDGRFIGLDAPITSHSVLTRNNGTMKCLDADHIDLWDEYKSKAGCPADRSFDYYPRGKIVFLTKPKRYKVTWDSILFADKSTQDSLIKHYHLPQDSTFFESNPAYRSHRFFKDCPLPDGLTPATSDELEEAWSDVWEKYSDCNTIDVQTLPGLFLRTWKYFIENLHEHRWIAPQDMRILKYIARFSGGRDYAEGIPPSVTSAWLCLTQSFLENLESLRDEYGYDGFFDGVMFIAPVHRCEWDFYFNKFEKSFEELREFFADEDDEEEWDEDESSDADEPQ